MNLSMLKSVLCTAVESSRMFVGCEAKNKFLENLLARASELAVLEQTHLMTRVDLMAEILENSACFPVCDSRLDPLDLPRRVNCITWSNPKAAIAGVRALIVECVTVSAGDCEVCGGNDLIYMYDADRQSVVRYCELCEQTLNKIGDQLQGQRNLRLPTKANLAEGK
jgi:hypothetical protein